MKIIRTILITFSLLVCLSLHAQQAGQAEVDKAMSYYLQNDIKRAIYWFEQAAQKGNNYAQLFVGGAYLDGMPGVSVNPQKAAYWCEKSANNGDPIGQLLYGYCFARGEGKSQDMKQAIFWWTKSANQNNVDAQWNLVRCYYDEDAKQAAIWARKAAENGHAQAQQILGYLYAQGRGVAQNYGQAVEWYQKSIDQGYSWAYNNLALMYAYGKGVQKDFLKAHELIDKAIALEPNESNFLDSKGEICLAEGDMQKAQNIWNELKARFPEKVKQSVNDPNDIFCATMLKKERK